MNILIINSSDTRGGAAKAAYRYKQALKTSGMNVRMLVMEKMQMDDEIIVSGNQLQNFFLSRLDKYTLKLKGHKANGYFSLGTSGLRLSRHPLLNWADVINVHWWNRGMLSINEFKEICSSEKKVVWTLHDSWAFTGGCHLPSTFACERFMLECGRCPALNSDLNDDLSSQILEKKKKSWGNRRFEIITPSKWLAAQAERSSLLHGKKISILGNPIDSSVFFYNNREKDLDKWGLDPSKKVVLFGAYNAFGDKNKGFDLLSLALESLPSSISNNIQLVVFGTNDSREIGRIPVKSVGMIQNEHELASLYSSADLFILPSRSENLPNTIMEALCCGVPSIGFRVGGIPDLITHHENGYLASPYDTADLANGIKVCLETPFNRELIGKMAHEKFSFNSFATQFKKIIGNENPAY